MELLLAEAQGYAEREGVRPSGSFVYGLALAGLAWAVADLAAAVREASKR